MVGAGQLAIGLGRFSCRGRDRKVELGGIRKIPFNVIARVSPVKIGFCSPGVLAASLFSTAKRNPHCSENQLAQEHDSILAIHEPAVKRFDGYSIDPAPLLNCFT
jgi:hypothetical protein